MDICSGTYLRCNNEFGMDFGLVMIQVDLNYHRVIHDRDA